MKPWEEAVQLNHGNLPSGTPTIVIGGSKLEVRKMRGTLYREPTQNTTRFDVAFQIPNILIGKDLEDWSFRVIFQPQERLESKSVKIFRNEGDDYGSDKALEHESEGITGMRRNERQSESLQERWKYVIEPD